MPKQEGVDPPIACLGDKADREHAAEEQRPPDDVKRLPAGEDHQRQGDPAAPVDDAFLPGRREGEGEVCPAYSSEGATEGDVEEADRLDRDAGCVGGGGVFADRAHVHAVAGAVEHKG